MRGSDFTPLFSAPLHRRVLEMHAQGSLVSTAGEPCPKFNYYLDASDPDILILRCQDDSFVAAFSPDGATKEGIIEVAKEDYQERIKDHRASRGQRATEEHRSA